MYWHGKLPAKANVERPKWAFFFNIGGLFYDSAGN
jgi:hypothetical protein